jgi:hypothetical protein
VRIAIVSDIHGNRTAFEAVLTDLRETSPDLILHGGDLADSGSNPTEIVDRIRDLGWNGVLGNTDEMHSRPESLEEFASQSSAPPSLWAAVREMAAATHAMLGEDRVAWIRTLPRTLVQESIALVHASPESPWRSPGPEASDAELEAIYGPLQRPIIVYGQHSPLVCPNHSTSSDSADAHRQYGQCEPVLRRRCTRLLPIVGRLETINSACGIRCAKRTQPPL